MQDWFKDRLRELRTAAGLTQGELAEKAGLTRVGVAQLEIGRRKPAWETVLALCKALGVTCEEFTVKPSVTPEEEPEAPRRGRPKKVVAPSAESPAETPVKKTTRKKGERKR